MSAIKRISPLLAICFFLVATLLVTFAVSSCHQSKTPSAENKQQAGEVSENPSPEESQAPSAENEGPEPGDVSDNPLKGRTVFVNKGCVKCHSVWGVGGKLGPDLSRAGMGRSFLQISGLLWSHSPRMVELMEQRGVSRPTFTPDEMGELVSYLYYLNYFNEPGDAVSGRALFSEKGCVMCHSVGGLGGTVASSLDKYHEYASPLFLAQGMWNQGPRMAGTQRTHGMLNPALQGKQLADIAAYVRGQAFGNNSEQK